MLAWFSLFLPEIKTIDKIFYIKQNINILKKNIC